MNKTHSCLTVFSDMTLIRTENVLSALHDCLSLTCLLKINWTSLKVIVPDAPSDGIICEFRYLFSFSSSFFFKTNGKFLTKAKRLFILQTVGGSVNVCFFCFTPTDTKISCHCVGAAIHQEKLIADAEDRILM